MFLTKKEDVTKLNERHYVALHLRTWQKTKHNKKNNAYKIPLSRGKRLPVIT